MKKRVLTDVKIECEVPSYITNWYQRDPEKLAKATEDWIREFKSFVRDHRSQDDVYMEVVRVYKEQCSYCNYKWEEDEDGCPVCCDKAVKEWEKERELNYS